MDASLHWPLNSSHSNVFSFFLPKNEKKKKLGEDEIKSDDGDDREGVRRDDGNSDGISTQWCWTNA